MLVHYAVSSVKDEASGLTGTRSNGEGGDAMSSVDDEREIHALFNAGDRALMSADLEALARIFADDYVQYDPSGKAVSKQEVLTALRSGAVRYPSIVSTGRRIRLFGEVAIVHGSELDEVEAEGRRFSVRYLYMDVVCKRDGRWQIVGSQLVKPEVEG
jgi:uncharacterized protein (TIGR02246 family)